MTSSGSNVAPRARLAVGAWLAMLLGAAPFAGSAHEIEFASVEKARAVLGARDDFVARLSPFDRAARVKSAHDVSEDEYLAFARAAAREWSNDERARITAAFAAIEPKLDELLPALDAPVLLIKTSGGRRAAPAIRARTPSCCRKRWPMRLRSSGSSRTRSFTSPRATTPS
jgi:hypothetical protein